GEAGRRAKELSHRRVFLCSHPSMPSPAYPVPDLLSAEPALRIDAGTLKQAIVFAIAASASQDVLDNVLVSAKLPATSWRKGGFARDLYVDTIATKCLEV